jgi:hypothetical protein
MRVGDIPVVFLSYDEPWAEAFWLDLERKAPDARRVKGVRGLDACHKAAAREAGGPRFITVDADTIVHPEFFEADLPDAFLNDRCHVEWPSRNVVNGLCYGNGSLKCWSSRMVAQMLTHEAAPAGTLSLDHDIGGRALDGRAVRRVSLPALHSDTYPAETPYHAFRCGFREGVRLSQFAGPLDRPIKFAMRIGSWAEHRLKVWCSLGTHAPNGLWLIYGARLGLWMARCTEWHPSAINDYRWFDQFWNSMIVARFAPGGTRCRYTGFAWDRPRLEDEVVALGGRIGRELGFEVLDLTAETSAFFLETGEEVLAYSMVDSLGAMYLTGEGVARDYAQAREMFEVGALLNVPGAINNIARMCHRGQGTAPDPAMAAEYYEAAIALENPFAPYHLAALLQQTDPDGPGVAERCRELVRLSAERGFDPDAAAS